MKIEVVRDGGELALVELEHPLQMYEGDRLDRIVSCYQVEHYFTKAGRYDGWGAFGALPISSEESHAEFAADSEFGILHRMVVGALRSCIEAHGPVTATLVGSAAKRVVGQMLNTGGSGRTVEGWRGLFRAASTLSARREILWRETLPHGFVPQDDEDRDLCEQCDEVQSHPWHELYELRRRVATLEKAQAQLPPPEDGAV